MSVSNSRRYLAQANPMIRVMSIFITILLVLVVYSLSIMSNAEDSSELDLAPIATFSDGESPTRLAWLRDGKHIRIADHYMAVEYCKYPDLLLCITQPFHILLPKKKGKRNLEIAGTTYEIVVSSGADTPLPENICEAYALWLRVRNTDLSLDSWYFFSRKWGLLQIVTFMKGDELDQVPGNIFLKNSGHVFTLKQLCESENNPENEAKPAKE